MIYLKRRNNFDVTILSIKFTYNYEKSFITKGDYFKTKDLQTQFYNKKDIIPLE